MTKPIHDNQATRFQPTTQTQKTLNTNASTAIRRGGGQTQLAEYRRIAVLTVRRAYSRKTHTLVIATSFPTAKLCGPSGFCSVLSALIAFYRQLTAECSLAQPSPLPHLACALSRSLSLQRNSFNPGPAAAADDQGLLPVGDLSPVGATLPSTVLRLDGARSSGSEGGRTVLSEEGGVPGVRGGLGVWDRLFNGFTILFSTFNPPLFTLGIVHHWNHVCAFNGRAFLFVCVLCGVCQCFMSWSHHYHKPYVQ